MITTSALLITLLLIAALVVGAMGAGWVYARHYRGMRADLLKARAAAICYIDELADLRARQYELNVVLSEPGVIDAIESVNCKGEDSER